MSLLTIVRGAVKLVDKVVKTLEATVTFEKYVSSGDGMGTPTYPYGPVSLRAIVEFAEVESATGSGLVVDGKPKITFLDIAALMTATLGEGIKEQDRITLADGTVGEPDMINGFMDATTGRLMYYEVTLG